MAWDMSNILVNLSTANAGADAGLSTRVSALETTVGDETGGLVKDVDDLETTVATLDANVYSSEEIKIGKWGTDDLYRKIVSIGELPNNTTKSVDTLLTNVTVRKYDIYASNATTTNIIKLPYPGYNNVNTIEVDFLQNTGIITIETHSDKSAYTAYAIIEYTKNSEQANNTRKKGGKK